jgi:hypothetical protein
MEDDGGPAFAYTVGLHHSFGHPELIVVGLPLDVGHSVLNVAGESIRRGVRYSEGVQFDDFLENRPCVFRRMPESQYRNYLGWARSSPILGVFVRSLRFRTGVFRGVLA